MDSTALLPKTPARRPEVDHVVNRHAPLPHQRPQFQRSSMDSRTYKAVLQQWSMESRLQAWLSIRLQLSVHGRPLDLCDVLSSFSSQGQCQGYATRALPRDGVSW